MSHGIKQENQHGWGNRGPRVAQAIVCVEQGMSDLFVSEEKDEKPKDARKLCWNFSPFTLFLLSTYVDDEDRRSLLIPSQIHEYIQGGKIMWFKIIV